MESKFCKTFNLEVSSQPCFASEALSTFNIFFLAKLYHLLDNLANIYIYIYICVCVCVCVCYNKELKGLEKVPKV